jgi:hypothetical protein
MKIVKRPFENNKLEKAKKGLSTNSQMPKPGHFANKPKTTHMKGRSNS